MYIAAYKSSLQGKHVLGSLSDIYSREVSRGKKADNKSDKQIWWSIQLPINENSAYLAGKNYHNDHVVDLSQ